MEVLESPQHLAFQAPGDTSTRLYPNGYGPLQWRIIASERRRKSDDESSPLMPRTILSAGVTQFIDLTDTHEREPYAGLM